MLNLSVMGLRKRFELAVSVACTGGRRRDPGVSHWLVAFAERGFEGKVQDTLGWGCSIEQKRFFTIMTPLLPQEFAMANCGD